MEWVLLILAIIIGLFLLLIFLKVNVFVNLYHGQDNDHVKIKIKALFGLIHYKFEIPVIQVDDDSASIVVKAKSESGKSEEVKGTKKEKFTPDEMYRSVSDMKTFLEHVVGLHTIVRKFLKKVTIREIEWHTAIGVGDAAYTGMLTGALWALKGSVIGIISAYMRMKEMPRMTITPHFQMLLSQTRFTCMIHFRIGHAMLAGIKLFKFWKGGRPKFKTKPLSALTNEKTKSV